MRRTSAIKDIMLGLQIRQRQRAVSLALAQKFLTVPVANVSDCMSRLFGGGADLRPMHRGDPMSGPAFTVKVRPGDNLMIHKALEMALPGDVIVVDGGGDLTNALVGEIMTSVGKHRKLAGMVIYGAVRDAAALKESDFPVFASGVTHRGPYRDGPGEINTSIAINGMVIEPGDLIIGDGDGFLCVPYDQADALYAAATAKGLLETKMLEDIRSGGYRADWVEESLARLNCSVD
jgi:RraA family protein